MHGATQSEHLCYGHTARVEWDGGTLQRQHQRVMLTQEVFAPREGESWDDWEDCS